MIDADATGAVGVTVAGGLGAGYGDVRRLLRCVAALRCALPPLLLVAADVDRTDVGGEIWTPTTSSATL